VLARKAGREAGGGQQHTADESGAKAQDQGFVGSVAGTHGYLREQAERCLRCGPVSLTHIKAAHSAVRQGPFTI
jgi:hypothetical protein